MKKLISILLTTTLVVSLSPPVVYAGNGILFRKALNEKIQEDNMYYVPVGATFNVDKYFEQTTTTGSTYYYDYHPSDVSLNRYTGNMTVLGEGPIHVISYEKDGDRDSSDVESGPSPSEYYAEFMGFVPAQTEPSIYTSLDTQASKDYYYKFVDVNYPIDFSINIVTEGVNLDGTSNGVLTRTDISDTLFYIESSDTSVLEVDDDTPIVYSTKEVGTVLRPMKTGAASVTVYSHDTLTGIENEKTYNLQVISSPTSVTLNSDASNYRFDADKNAMYFEQIEDGSIPISIDINTEPEDDTFNVFVSLIKDYENIYSTSTHESNLEFSETSVEGFSYENSFNDNHKFNLEVILPTMIFRPHPNIVDIDGELVDIYCKTDPIDVYCIIPPKSIEISSSSNSETIGSTYQLNAEVYPLNAFNKNINWSSSSPEIAEVDENGVVKIISKGSYSITATAEYIPVSGIPISKTIISNTKKSSTDDTDYTYHPTLPDTTKSETLSDPEPLAISPEETIFPDGYEVVSSMRDLSESDLTELKKLLSEMRLNKLGITRKEIANVLDKIYTFSSSTNSTRNYMDMSSDNPYLTSINNVLLFRGYPDNTFKPDEVIKRSEIAQLFSCLPALSKVYPEVNYSDISASDWFFNAVRKTSGNNLFYGYEDLTFKPTKEVTEYEASLVFERLLKKKYPKFEVLD